MNRSLKIFMACVLGGGIGSFVALQFTSHFWFLGLIAGGIVGYFSYDLNAVAVATWEVWDKIIGFNFSKNNLFETSTFLSMIFVCAFAVWLMTPESGFLASLDKEVRTRIGIYLAFMLIFVFISALAKASVAADQAQKRGAKFVESEEIYARTLALYFNPIAAFSVTPIWGLWQCLKYGAKFLALCWRLCRYYWPLFRLL